MDARTRPHGWFVTEMFCDEPAGTFNDGYIFRSAPDMTGAQQDPDFGYFHYSLADPDKLTWTVKMYEIFDLPMGTPVSREGALTCFTKDSRTALERVRTYGLRRNYGFILDAEIEPEGVGKRTIRVLAAPIFEDRRIVGFHGLVRKL